jgi:hypothetical protein
MKRLFGVLLVTTMLSAISYGADAQTFSNLSPSSLWDQNGSIMRVLSEGTHIRIVYDQPRPDVSGTGIVRGTLLFDGVRDRNSLSGTAFAFNLQGCPNVSGKIVPDSQIELTGSALLPRRWRLPDYN